MLTYSRTVNSFQYSRVLCVCVCVFASFSIQLGNFLKKYNTILYEKIYLTKIYLKNIHPRKFPQNRPKNLPKNFQNCIKTHLKRLPKSSKNHPRRPSKSPKIYLKKSASQKSGQKSGFVSIQYYRLQFCKKLILKEEDIKNNDCWLDFSNFFPPGSKHSHFLASDSDSL